MATAALLAGCGADDALTAPDRAIVETLAAVHLAEARAELAGSNVDSARASVLSSHGATTADYDAWLDGAARDPVAGAALWEAVASALDSARTAGGR